MLFRSIQGDVLAAEAVIRGHIKGDIRARKLQLCATCHVEGSILYQTLAIETGAFYEGGCRPSKDPLVPPEQQRQQAAAAQAAPRPATATASGIPPRIVAAE